MGRGVPEESKSDGVERSLALLWPTDERSGRGPRPRLSVEKIVDKAIAIADAEGLDALSMQRLAGEFGYSPMSLYRYVPGKTQLVDVMMDVACGPPPDLAEVPGGWRAEVETWIDELWRMYQAHDWLARVQIRNPPMGPNQLGWFEALLRSLEPTGLDHEEMAALAMFVSASLRDLARVATDLVPMGLGYARVLENVYQTDRFPMVASLMSAASAEEPRPGEESGEDAVRPVVRFGVDLLLDGVERYVAAAKEGRQSPS